MLIIRQQSLYDCSSMHGSSYRSRSYAQYQRVSHWFSLMSALQPQEAQSQGGSASLTRFIHTNWSPLIPFGAVQSPGKNRPTYSALYGCENTSTASFTSSLTLKLPPLVTPAQVFSPRLEKSVAQVYGISRFGFFFFKFVVSSRFNNQKRPYSLLT